MAQFKNIDWNDIEEMTEDQFSATVGIGHCVIEQSVDEWTEVVKPKKQKCVKSMDKHLNCKKCSDTFEFRADQQLKYKNAGWAEPKICRACQKTRHQERSKLIN